MQTVHMQLARFRSTVLAILTGGMLCNGGCDSWNSELADVVGRITLNGDAVEEGNVVFENAERGWVYLSRIGEQGEYRLEGVKIGEYKVLIKPPPQSMPDETSGNQGTVIVARNVIPGSTSISARFHVSQTSPLKARVVVGDNRFNFDLANTAGP